MTETGDTVIEMASMTETVKIKEVQKENTNSPYKPKIISIGPLHNGPWTTTHGGFEAEVPQQTSEQKSKW